MSQPLPKLMRLNQYGLVLIIVLLPFHAFFTTWLGASFGHLLVFRAWKEVLLAIMGGLILLQVQRDPGLLKAILSHRVNQLILAFTSLLLLLWAIFRPNFAAVVQGLIIDLRFLAVFVYAQVLMYYGWRPSAKFLAKLIIIPATIVVIFGLLQATILPHNFLSHFGYSKNTISPYLPVYQGSSIIRINSFLRGPNPLGAYLIVPFGLLAAWLIKNNRTFKWWYGLWFIPGLVTLYSSQSRSAWVGLLLSLVVVMWFGVPRAWRPKAILAGGSLIILVGMAMFSLRHTYSIKNIVFHTADDHKTTLTSNDGHLESIESGWRDTIKHPFGEGPGTAGPASVRDPQKSDITENFYLQIAQEAGWFGLALFVSIVYEVFLLLYRARDDMLNLSLLASLSGITLANMFLPVWADDTLSLIWWAVAGLVIGQILFSSPKTRRKPVRV